MSEDDKATVVPPAVTPAVVIFHASHAGRTRVTRVGKCSPHVSAHSWEEKLGEPGLLWGTRLAIGCVIGKGPSFSVTCTHT